MSGKVKSVEGLKGLACLAVLLSHLSLIFYPYLHGQKSALIETNINAFILNYPIGFFYAGTSAVFFLFKWLHSYLCVRKKGGCPDCIDQNDSGPIFQANISSYSISAGLLFCN